ncbi:bifunctional protein STORR-like [Pecten maximus]|uniref:bifunctional protein STORR-like n=1 Tax=Pecten maximus TaxID=6579 RepID=UPI00145904AE|nr:bifunctional protein STORR-like [Pecten maximus]
MEIFGIFVPSWVILLLVAIILYTYMMSRDFWTFKKMGIPGPTPRPILGNLAAMVKEGIRDFDRKALQKYGKVYGHFDGLSTNLVVADKEMLREILVKQFNNFVDRRTLDGFAGDLEHGLTNVKGAHWKHNRSIITPTFSSGKLRQMMPLIQEACETLIQTTRKAVYNGENGQVEMRRLFAGYTMDVISSTAFGIHVDSQSNPDDLFVMHSKKMFDFTMTKPWMLVVLFLPMLKPLLKQLGVGLFPKDSMAYFRKLTTQLVDERRRNKVEGRKDFLQLVVDTQECRLELDQEDEDSKEQITFLDKNHQKGLTFDEILGNSELFFVAGYETTAITLTMAAFNLATNPECQDKLREEIEEELGSDPCDSENIKKLQYLDMCINETLRMYPPAMRFNRMCVKTTTVKDITIPSGMAVTVPVYAMHHDPDVWEKPEIFNPERFSPSQKEHHDPMDFLPFGYGPRNCIGMRLALMEAKMATAYLVRNFRLCVGNKTDIPPKMEERPILKPIHSWLKLEAIITTVQENIKNKMDIFGITVPAWAILLIVAILLYTYMMSRDFWTFKKMGIPGPTPRPIVGNMVTMVREGIREFDRKAIKKYGKVYGHFDVISTNLVVADKEMLREILVKQFSNFVDRRTLGGLSGDLEHGLTNVKGAHWKHNRSIITPTFSSGKLRQMIPLIQEACETLIQTARKAVNNGENGQVEMRRLFAGYTMDVISSTAFGIHVDSQSNPDDLFVMHSKKMFDFTMTKPWMLVVLFLPMVRSLLKTLGVSVFPKDSMAYFRKLTSQLVDERRRNKAKGRKDFLQLVVDAQEGRLELDPEDEDLKEQITCLDKNREKGLTFDEILGNSEVFFVAGYETTAITLTMTAFNLATNPECQDKLREEIEEELGSDPCDAENIKKLQYLDMCINETLRMYPPAMRFNRMCVKTTTVKDITIPSGMAVTVPVYAMHHDPDVWEKPEIFNPERFSPSQREHHDPMDFIPFGYGPRNCIGMRLALMEAKMATTYLVRNFRLCVGNKTDIPPKMEERPILKPIHSWLKLEAIM